MTEQLLAGILLAAAVALLGGILALVRVRGRALLDRRRVYRWLRCYTRDEPGESHVDTSTLAKGTRLPEDRVRLACMSDRRVYRLPKGPEEWSIWREEPQSIYEKRGVLDV